MKLSRLLLCLTVVAALAAPAVAQMPSGTLTGNVTDGAAPLPGVTVTVTSPALQGSRSAVTNTNGDYILTFLPPGEYNVRFELAGFQKVEANVKLSAAQTRKLDADLPLAQLSEEVTVTGSYETISSSIQASTTFEQKLMDDLPIARNIASAVALAPGVHSTGPSGNITIQGSQSYESLFMVNGVVINENLRGQPFDLFVEDAIQETTTSTSGISAEYGRFSGGVVNTITKSGGNEVHGSFRVNFTKGTWSAKTPLTVSQDDTLNKVYEATLGGYILKDKLWYFLAGRDRSSSTAEETYATHIPYTYSDKEKRYEGKLTFSITPRHRIIGSYMKIDESEDGNAYSSVMDLASIYNRSLPQELFAANYTGVITDNFFVEGQYSRRKMSFVDSGSKYTDLIKGTLFVDRPTGYRWHSPTFCGVCGPELRDNEDYLAKASWFLSTDSLGTHDLMAGYDQFNDQRKVNNHQSGSDFRIYLTGYIIGDDGVTLYPKLNPYPGGTYAYIQWNPILESSKGTNFKTKSTFINDRWRLDNNWSFNLGLRYDKNDGVDSAGNLVAKDSRLSPRLGATWDPKGNGDILVNASYGRYVMAVANTVANTTSAAGSPATMTWYYKGPAINMGGAPYIGADEALQMMWDWFFGMGGTDTAPTRSISIPGGTTAFPKSLDSPYADEYSIGVTKRLGTRGVVRADYVHRKYASFYTSRTDMTTGTTVLPTGRSADLTWIVNNDSLLSRKYDGLTVQAQYRFSDTVNVGGNYTLSWAKGNWEGETSNNGPITSGIMQYPEYRDPKWNAPEGYLSIDQRNKLRAWVVWDLLNSRYNRLNVSVLQNYWSGSPYGAVGSVDTRPYVNNPGYLLPPSSVTYYYTSRSAYHTDDITRTDLSLNYSFTFPALGKDVEIFVQPEILNVFNEHGIDSVNTTVYDPTDGLTAFNPFTEKPVEGVNWEKGSNFGKPTVAGSYQDPRTFRLSVGFRF